MSVSRLASLTALALLAACGPRQPAEAPAPVEDAAPDPALASPYAMAAMAFVNQIYAGYGAGQPPQLPALASSDLHQLLQNIEYLPSDPFCDCQSWQGLSHQARVISADNQSASIAVQVSGYGPPKVMTLDLVMTPLGWKLSDIRGPGARSLRQSGGSGPVGGAYRVWYGAEADPAEAEALQQMMGGGAPQ